MEGSWTVRDDAGSVRLRSGRIGLVKVDVQAPVVSGSLTIGGGLVRLDLDVRLDQLRTGNPIMQVAARTLVTSHDAHELVYRGQGPLADTWEVSGVASAGTVNIDLALRIDPLDDAMSAIQISGSAHMGTIHLPLPGLGTVRDFGFDVEARLGLRG